MRQPKPVWACGAANSNSVVRLRGRKVFGSPAPWRGVRGLRTAGLAAVCVVACTVGAVAFADAPVSAEPPAWSALLISGGGVPSSNAVAHEKNLLFVDRVLRGQGLDEAAIQTYVSVGRETLPDTAYLGEFPHERWELVVLARLFGGASSLGLRYRPHEIAGPAGSARKADVLGALRDAVAELDDGQTLLLYTTDHGVPDPRREGESALVLWGDDTLSTRELREVLDAGPQRGRVILHMSQCFSGGFAHAMFADDSTAVTGQERCGFFSALPDRIATGCTPDLNEADYDDYTTRFFAALSGRDRVGRTVDSADYDEGGRVSLAEAHAYAVGTQDTIDVPMKTSEFYLEHIGVDPTAGWKQALAAATPDELAAWRFLSQRLELTEGDPAAQIRQARTRLERQRQEWSRQQREWEPDAGEAASRLRVGLLERWPVLESPFHPEFAPTLEDGGEQIRDYLSGARAFAEWQAALAEMSRLSAKLAAAELEDAWWLRAQRLSEHLRRAARLAADSKETAEWPQWAAFERLRACEAAIPAD